MNITDRIADVIGEHQYRQRNNHRHDWECACGKTFGFKDEADRHLAIALVADLDMAVEFAFTRDDGKPKLTRYVTGWNEYR